jgi:hypothetical protein
MNQSSIMSLVKVWTEVDDNGKCQSLPAKIISKKGNTYKICYLSATDDRDHKNRKVYKYEDETYEISDESITEYLESDSEIDFGLEHIGNGQFVKYDYDSDDDEDYVPSSEDEDEEDTDSEDEDEEDTDYEDDENFSD